MAEKKYTSRNQSIERALDILQSFTREQPEWSPTEMSKKVKLNISTAHRLMQTLQYRGLLEQDPGTGKYRIGLGAFRIGSNYITHNMLERHSLPVLEELSAKTGQPIHLAYLDTLTAQVVFIFNQEGRQIVQLPRRAGMQGPAHITSLGKAIMAFTDDQEKLDRVFKKIVFRKYASRSHTTLKTLKADLARIRKTGYAIDDRESGEHVRCVGAPIFNHLGRVVSAVSVSGFTDEITPVRIPRLAKEVMAAAGRISEKMGYTT
jgi:IclR family acetate operon transcriptional repressor